MRAHLSGIPVSNDQTSLTETRSGKRLVVDKILLMTADGIP